MRAGYICLLNEFVITDYEGDEFISINNMDSLHIAIAGDLVTMPRNLTGKELSFLRKELNLSQKSLGRWLGRNEQAVARWEKEEASDPIVDQFIHILWMDVKQQKVMSAMELVKRLQDLDQKDYKKRSFQESNDGWRPAA